MPLKIKLTWPSADQSAIGKMLTCDWFQDSAMLDAIYATICNGGNASLSIQTRLIESLAHSECVNNHLIFFGFQIQTRFLRTLVRISHMKARGWCRWQNIYWSFTVWVESQLFPELYLKSILDRLDNDR